MGAPIVVLAQNPGEIKTEDTFRLAMAHQLQLAVRDADVTGDAVEAWYYADFKTSHGHEVISKVLGPGWLESGLYLYSNAVRCRTKENAMPPDEWMHACKLWTNVLLRRPETRAVITIGQLAAKQLFEKETLPPIGKAVINKKTGWIVLALPHYVKWTIKTVESYAQEVMTITKKVGESE
jgi:uracil-DNA glycosylase